MLVFLNHDVTCYEKDRKERLADYWTWGGNHLFIDTFLNAMPVKTIVKRVARPTKDSLTLWFDKVDKLTHYLPGQHIFLSVIIKEESFTRTYSINTSPFQDDEIGVTMRVIPGGKVSNYLSENAKAGMEVWLEGPAGQFTLIPSSTQSRHYIFFAAGSGITPVISMIRSVLYAEPLSRISLIYSNHAYDKIIFKEELAILEQKFADRFQIRNTLTDTDGVPPHFNITYQGQLSRLIIKRIIKEVLASSDLKAIYYMCGPYGYMEVIRASLDALGIPGDDIHQEHFYIPGNVSSTDFSSLPPTEVRLQVRDKEIMVHVPSGTSILQASLNAGLSLPHSCKAGQCGSCRALLISGEVEMRTNHILAADEIKEGQVLLCEGFPKSSNVVIKPIHVNAEVVR